MPTVPVTITRFIDDDQPGWVECELTDAAGRTWTFFEKVPIVTSGGLTATSRYPVTGSISCEVVRREAGPDGTGLTEIDTDRPFGVASVDGKNRFIIPTATLVVDREPDS